MMKPKHSLSILLATGILLVAACTPVVTPGGAASTSAPSASAGSSTTTASVPDDAATATVTTRSLRVRNAPSETAEVIAGIGQNEQYRVIGISSDGLWVQLAIDGAPGGSGWVSASFVSVEGPITDAATVTVPVASAPITASIVSTESTEVTTTTTAVATPAPGFALVVTDGTRLRVRSEPAADAEIVGYVYDGETYPVLEVSADGAWVRIGGSTETVSDNPDGGWVAAEFVVMG
jgi:uncharacterized protein YgiM (DUF1202 family)